MKTNVVGRPGFLSLNVAILSSIGCMQCNRRCSEMVSVCKVGQACGTMMGKWNCCCCLHWENGIFAVV